MGEGKRERNKKGRSERGLAMMVRSRRKKRKIMKRSKTEDGDGREEVKAKTEEEKF